MTDIVELLRERNHGPDCNDAADEIERLRAELARKTRDADHFFQLSGRQLEQLATLEGDCIALGDERSHERRKALEEAAVLCEAIRPDGGRDWTETQEQCYSALTHAAENIRALIGKPLKRA